MPHLDTYGAFATWLMAEHGFSARDIARVCAYNPGRFVNEFLPPAFGKGYGLVEPGYVGSLTILDFAETVDVVTRSEIGEDEVRLVSRLRAIHVSRQRASDCGVARQGFYGERAR